MTDSERRGAMECGLESDIEGQDREAFRESGHPDEQTVRAPAIVDSQSGGQSRHQSSNKRSPIRLRPLPSTSTLTHGNIKVKAPEPVAQNDDSSTTLPSKEQNSTLQSAGHGQPLLLEENDWALDPNVSPRMAVPKMDITAFASIRGSPQSFHAAAAASEQHQEGRVRLSQSAGAAVETAKHQRSHNALPHTVGNDGSQSQPSATRCRNAASNPPNKNHAVQGMGWLLQALSLRKRPHDSNSTASSWASTKGADNNSTIGTGMSLTKRFGSLSKPMMSLLSFRQPSTKKRASVVSVASEPDEETNWAEVMTSLRREKAAAAKRLEEQYTNRSLWCLVSDNPLREALITLVEWKPFTSFVLFLIVANCTLLMFDDPICKCEGGTGRDACTESELYRRALYSGWHCDRWDEFLGQWMYIAELVFTALFTAEMVCKIIARGFALHKHSYLRDRWNWIDFIVVLASLASLLPQTINVQFLRTVRVLRPLRTMTRIKGMRPLIKTFLRSFKALANVILLLLFFFCVFGILGIELLSGALRGRCYVDPLNNGFPPAVYARLVSQQVPFRVQPLNIEGTWNADVGVCSSTAGGMGCEPVALDGIRYNTTCSRRMWCGAAWCEHAFNGNPFGLGGGQLSYDNIFGAFLSLFQVLTLEGWSDLLYMYQDGWSYWGSRLFHSSWVIVGSFFVIQLALAVLVDTFMKTLEDNKTERAREALDESALLVPNGQPTTSSFHARALSGIKKASRRSSLTMTQMWDAMTKTKLQWTLQWFKLRQAAQEKTAGYRRVCRVVVQFAVFQNCILAAIFVNILVMGLDWHDQVKFEDSLCQRRCELDPDLPSSAACAGPLFNRSFTSDGTGGGMHPRQTLYCFLEDDSALQGGSRHFRGGLQNCSERMTEEDCGIGGVQCMWFQERGEGGACQRGLYNSTSFSIWQGAAAETGDVSVSSGWKLSLRELCGEDVTGQCPNYPPDLKRLLESVNLVLVFVFIAEMALKLTGLGWREYMADSFNLFDCFIVTASIVELISTYSSNSSGSGSLLASLRGLRLFRLFKLARSWESMRKILNTLGVAIHSLGPLTIVWIMFMYIFGLLCMQLFGGRFRVQKADFPRSNFDSFLPSAAGHGAFVVIFQMISTENWINVMYSCIVSAGGGVRGWLAALVTIAIVMFGNYMIMNLFISILLEGFAEDDEEASLKKSVEPRSQRLRKGLSVLLGKRGNAKTLPSLDDWGVDSSSDRPGISSLSRNRPDSTSRSRTESSDPAGFYDNNFIESDEDSSFGGKSPNLKVPRVKTEQNRIADKDKHPVRRFAGRIVRHPVFDNVMLVCILISSLILILEKPDDRLVAEACPRPPLALNCTGLPVGHMESTICPRYADDPHFGRSYLPCGTSDSSQIPECCSVVERSRLFYVMDSCFTFLFLLELCLKVLAFGLAGGEDAYLKKAWNWLDAMIVATSLIRFFGDQHELKALSALRAFRALRPLRVITRNPGLKVAVKCLVASIPAMINVIVVVVVWFSMYAMLGVQAFKGTFFRCTSLQDGLFFGNAFFPASGFYTPTQTLSGEKSVPTIIECIGAGNVQGGSSWEDQEFSFNTYPDALLALFEMATTEGWLEVMAAVTDAVHTGVSPLPNFRPWLALYCVTHIIIGAFILLNLIVGFVINNYNKIQKSNDGITPFLTEEQHSWKEVKKLIYHLRPRQRRKMPLHPWRAKLFKMVTHRHFEFGITFLIIANVVVMMLQSFDQDPCKSVAMFWANFMFAVVFTIEATIKIIAFGFRWYFLDRFNIFDFFVVILVDTSVGLAFIGQPLSCHAALDSAGSVDVYGLNIVRAFRIARVFRLIRQFKGLRKMIETLMISLPSLGNIAGLLALMIVIFAVLGVTFFYNVRIDQDPYGRLSEHCNYVTFDNALWTLHRQTTGEAWNGIMYYSRSDDPYRACDKCYGGYLGEGCGGAGLSIVYHVLWQLFGTYVLMQLFTAVILENFSEMAHDDTAAGRALSTEALNQFVEVWTDLDPDGRELLPVDKLPELLNSLPPPLGIKNKVQVRCRLLQLMRDLAIPIRDDHIAYKDTFKACVKRVLLLEGTPTSGDTTKQVTCAEEFAARSVQSAFREWRETKLQVRKAMSRPECLPLYASPSDFLYVD